MVDIATVEASYRGIASDTPLVLFPVRLETRFRDRDLLVRIYPDDIHQDSHETALTANEWRVGKSYWDALWRAGQQPTDTPKQLQAWRQLVEQCGPQRAAWVERVTTPLNAQERPLLAAAEGQPSNPLPNVPLPPSDAPESLWNRAAYSAVLPNYWLAIGLYEDGQEMFRACSERITPDPLPTSPNPAAEHDADNMVDVDLQWMVDFDKAVAQGMGLRISLEPGIYEVPMLLVFGLKTELPSVETSARLGNLFNAHRYTWGLGLVPPGTPSNNTPDTRTVYSSRDPGGERSFADAGVPQGLDGWKLARALGVAPETFQRLPFGDLHDQSDAALMLNALWYATFDYYITILLNFSLPEADLNGWRDFVLRHVRAGGPLPALRVGGQPYGVLPVTALEHWDFARPALPGGAANTWIDVLKKLRTQWRLAIRHVPTAPGNRPNSASPDLDQRFLDILTNEAVAQGYVGRSAVGPEYIEFTWRTINARLAPNWQETVKTTTSSLLADLGFVDPERNLLNSMVYAAQSFSVDNSLVTEGPLSETEPLGATTNYIEWMVSATPEEIYGSEEPFLLFKLLRHSVLLAYAQAAVELELEQTGLSDSPMVYKRFHIGEPELVDLRRWTDLTHTPTLWRFLHEEPYRRDQALTKLLLDPAAGSPAATNLRHYLDQLLELSRIPTAALERLLRGTLDLLAYRLDAWITACATYRLDYIRDVQAGVPETMIGGFGWVEHLQRRYSQLPETEGYIHAPSLAHGATAAILHSGYLAHKQAGQNSTLAVNLSSSRVRAALELLEGVRGGQPLSALLGSRVERRLREQQLEAYIAELRQRYPLIAGKLHRSPDPQPAASATAAGNVPDGLALLSAWQADRNMFATWAGADVLAQIMQELEDICDAVNDVGLAESVYQIVQGGNPGRAGSILDAISRGEQPPAEIEVARTPRTGSALTHRLLVLFDAELPVAPDGWALQPRAEAEPYLNAWVGSMIGEPVNIRCAVHFLAPDNEQEAELIKPLTLTLDKLGLCPLDVVAWFDVNERASQTLLEQHVAAWAYQQYTRTRSADQPHVPQLRIIYERAPEDTDPSYLTFPDLMELSHAIRGLLQSGRPVVAEDLLASGQTQEEDMAKRASKALQQFVGSRDRLLECITLDSETKEWHISSGGSFDDVRKALFALTLFDVPEAAPRSAVGEDQAAERALADQAAEMVEITSQRIERCGRQTPVEQLQILFGTGFRALPQFGASYPNGATLQTSIQSVADVNNEPAQTVVPWLQRVARVRKGAARLERVLTYADAINFVADAANEPSSVRFRVAQLPIPSSGEERWVGLPAEAGRTVYGGRTSLAIHTPLGLDAEQTEFAGLWVDGWDEIVPNAQETTAVAFHCDAPGTTPPQSVLIAVHPSAQTSWTIDMVRDVLLETFELMKVRAAGPDLLGQSTATGHILPSLLFAYNRNHDTVETEFRASRGDSL